MGLFTDSHYRVRLTCGNCEAEDEYSVEYGVPVRSAARTLKCRKCGVVGVLSKEVFPPYYK